MTESAIDTGSAKAQKHGLSDLNPLSVCMFFLLLWSIFNGLLGFFVGHIFNISTGNWAALIVWVVFAISIPVVAAIAISKYFHSYTIVKVEEGNAGSKSGKATKSVDAQGNAPVQADASSEDSATDTSEESGSTNKKGWFSARCNDIASQYLLSKRETEVLFLLAKGHNAAFIQEQLCVSRSTAKTHINHIYRKLDIHTQQELLNMVEDIPRVREDGRVVGSFPGVMQIDNPRKVMEEAFERAAKTQQKNYRKDIFSD